MPNQRANQAFRAFLSAGALTLLVPWACSDSTAERLVAAKLAEGCLLTSDCEEGLKCVFQHCHDPCKADADCPDGQRCVRADEPGVDTPKGLHVCQLPDELSCKQDKDCPGYQTCGADLECRDPCTSDADCLPLQLCSTTDTCASTVEGRDHVDSNGNILTGSGGEGNSSGAALVEGGAPGNGAEGGSPGAGGGLEGTNPEPTDGGNGGTAGESSGEQGGAAGSAAVPSTYYETSDGIEALPNDRREDALALVPSASVWLNGSTDEDWFYVDTPDDGKAHLLSVRFVQEAGTTTYAYVLSADFNQLGKYTAANGTTGGTVYATLGPRTRAYVQLLSGAAGRVVLDWQLTDEDDPYVHGDKASATPIELGTEIRAQLLNRYVSASNKGSADWYQLDLAAGTATVRVIAAPGIHLSMKLIDANNVEKSNVTSAVNVTGDFAFTVTTAGHYYLRLNDYNVSAKDTDTPVWAAEVAPAYMTEQYAFQVLQ